MFLGDKSRFPTKSYSKDGLVPALRDLGLKGSEGLGAEDVVAIAKQIEANNTAGRAKGRESRQEER